VGNVILSRFDVRLYLREAGHVRKALAIMRELVLGRCDQTLPRQCSDRSLGHFVDVGWGFVPVIHTPELDRMLRGLRERHAPPASLVEDTFIRNVVLLRLPAIGLGCDLAELLLGFESSCVSCTTHGVGRLAAAGDTSPG